MQSFHIYMRSFHFGCCGWAYKSTELKLWCVCSAECGFESRLTLVSLKTLDTFGNCQKPFFPLCVSQHMHKITNCENLSLIGRRSCEILMKEKKHPCHTKLCAFRCLISRPQILNLRSRIKVGKIKSLLREPFSQCFILSSSPHYSLLSEVLCW